ncbi:MAG TPA: tetratricopeptide repeat protein [Thermoguttaceae bacterium]|nr:tetratricopeptide repeat protein [Thermoguttaceae bacterium]
MKTRTLGRNPVALLGLIALAAATDLAAQDTVTLSTGTGGQSKLTGRILDYTGSELRFEHASGRQQSYPAGQVLDITTSYGRDHTEADALASKGQFNQALALYAEARKADPRPWVRRRITAGIVRCYEALGQADRAGEEFLLLVQSDPQTLDFDCIPLTWMTRQPSAAMEQTAHGWFRREEPAAILLGASHLLAGPSREAALMKLGRLTSSADRRIALLATAQTWRTALITATDEQIDGWERTIEQMPESIASGPYYVLGLARARQQQWQRAALALMRVPILYPQNRPLAARALLDAGQALKQLDRIPQSVRLYGEVIRSYAEQTDAVATARSRMQAMRKDQS